jgi:NO-binding membrane sensor protein with MHYT domain
MSWRSFVHYRLRSANKKNLVSVIVANVNHSNLIGAIIVNHVASMTTVHMAQHSRTQADDAIVDVDVYSVWIIIVPGLVIVLDTLTTSML